jgi:hypothetical protein
MTPSGVSSPTDTAEGPQHGGGDSGGGTADMSGGRCGGDSGGATGDISGGRGSRCDNGDDKPESVPAATIGGSSSKRVVLDLPPPR